MLPCHYHSVWLDGKSVMHRERKRVCVCRVTWDGDHHQRMAM
jgi:hypothetical protein